ncbi:hypothetical protein [Zhihengliuella sp.]|uniref:hypothetical protein n=1 Tax=Zhihengliuella sp. TaxID=1954483 RepID=UPI00281186DB|nr:hypothetical protein [Zhihengliuella sp.]
MPWLRIGDTAANHPTVLAVLEFDEEDFDDRLINETFGFVVRCAAQSTAHLTDYVINRGTALSIAGLSRADKLLQVAIYAGYLTKEKRDLDDGQGLRTVYKLVDDDPDFIHMRTKEEIEWERQRKADNQDPALVIPVRLRDGDACRYCGLVVNWAARKGRLRGTYDHRQPGQGARTVEDSVVACGACNSSRKDDPAADSRLPLLPVPTKPYFHPNTIEWIANHDWAQRNGYKAPKPPAQTLRAGEHSGNGTTGRTSQGNGRSGPQSEGNGTTGPQRPAEATERVESTTPRPAMRAAASGPRAASSGNLPDQADPAERLPTGSGIPGTGRDGTGRAGTGRGGTGASSQPPPSGKKRGNPRKRPRKRR